MKGTLSVSWGPFGGFYWFHSKAVTRICFGVVAVTYVSRIEIDDLLLAWVERREASTLRSPVDP